MRDSDIANKEDNAVAKRLAEEAIALDPEYPSAYKRLSVAHTLDVWLKATDSPKQSITRAKELIEKAIALDTFDPECHAVLSLIFRTIGQHENAIVEGEKAVALGPNSVPAYSQLGAALRFSGMAEESIPVLKKALRLAPLSNRVFHSLGFSYLLAGQCGEAIQTCKEGTDRNPNDLFSQLCLASAYSACGREEEARAAAAEVLRINPKFSVDYFSKTAKYKKQENKELLFSGLRKAGLK